MAMTPAQRAKIDAETRRQNAQRKAAAAKANARIRASNAKHSAGYKKPAPKPTATKPAVKPTVKAKPRNVVARGKANIRDAYKRSGDYEGI